MKKILSLILCVIFVCLMLCGCTDKTTSTTTVTTAGNNSATDKKQETELVLSGIKLYATQIAALNAKNTEYDYTDSAILCDIDDNGTDELIMVHYSATCVHHDEEDKTGDAVAFNIKTMENDEVVHLIENEFFYEMNENTKGDVYKLSFKDEEYYDKCIGFHDYTTSEGKNGVMSETGKWQIFLLNGTKLERLRYMKYSFDYTMNGSEKVIDYDTCVVTYNGIDSNYKEFERWLSQYNPEYIMSSFDENHNSRDLLDELINM